jgi:hypothetical protein
VAAQVRGILPQGTHVRWNIPQKALCGNKITQAKMHFITTVDEIAITQLHLSLIVHINYIKLFKRRNILVTTNNVHNTPS